MNASADLCGAFTVNDGEDLRAIGQEDRGDQARLKTIISLTVDILVALVGGERGKWTVLVVQRCAIRIAVGTIGAAGAADVAGNRTPGIGEVAAAAAAGCAVTLKCVAQ